VGVELREEPATAEAEVLGVWVTNQRRGRLLVRRARLVPAVAVELTEYALWTQAELEGLAGALLDELGGGGPFELEVTDPLIRYAARRKGFTGGLRVPLLPPEPGARPSQPEPPPRNAGELATVVNGMIGRAVARAQRRPSRLLDMAYVATSGNPSSFHLRIDTPDGSAFNVVVPGSGHVMPEIVGLTCDTALGVHQAFPNELRPLHSIAFDKSDARFSRGRRRVSGLAQQSLARVHLNASLTAADRLVAARRHRTDHPPPKVPLQALPPATFVDGVVAHELWHIIEGSFETRRYRESIEFRRQLGEVLGVATLERAVQPRREDGAAGTAAHLQLREQVSDYATATTREATAELFHAWWWRRPPHPPVVERFGELLREYFPTARDARGGAG